MTLLKRLEIQGFKSFADKIDLEFGPGVSVVVGPNGCGKSNIADAVRWVLGEQSARSLRGERMEDIIFSGSERRRAVGMAEVSLTLDNTNGFLPVEFSEVRVTRRLYRSGESEFLINKAPCRLRDIQEMFMDTGLGKEAMAIIGQGRIEEVLSSKPEEKRLLIEEVAGITRYRFRKKEAIRKLEETEKNLVRIGDIIQELQNQSGPLRVQSEQAKAYKQCRDRIKELEINVWVHDLEEIKQRWQTVQGQLTDWRQELAEQEEAAAASEAEVSEYRAALARHDQRLTVQQQQIHQLDQQRERCESEIRLGQERQQSLADQTEELNTGIEELVNRLLQLQQEYEPEEGQVAQLKEELRDWESRLSRLEAEFRQAEAEVTISEASVNDGKTELIEVLNALGGCRHDLKQAVANQESQVRKLDELRQNRETFQNQKLEWEQRIAAEEDKLNQGQSAISELEQRQAASEKKRAETLQRAQEEQQNTRKIKDQLQATRSRLRVLQDMEQDFEGYGRAVREVLRCQKRGDLLTRGVCGAVAELLKVPAGLEKAIEVALGGALQNLVTENDQVASQVIQLLKERNWGRATFLPLNTLTVRSVGNDWRGAAPGLLGRAADLVEFVDKYRVVAEFLLGRVLVVETLEQALSLARETKYAWKIVTLAGDVVNPGGSITGGSQPQRGSTLLGRKQELTELEKLAAGLQVKLLNAQEREKKTEQQLSEIAQLLESNQQQINNLKIELAGRQRDLLYQREELRKVMQRGDVLNYEEYEARQQLEEDGRRRKELSRQITSLENEQSRLEALIESTQQGVKDKRQLLQDLQERITLVKVDAAAKDKELQGLTKSLERYWQTRQEIEQDCLIKKRRLGELTQKQAGLQEMLIKEEQNLARIIEQTDQAGAELADQQVQRNELSVRLAQAEANWRLGQKQLTELRERIHQAEMKAGRLEMEIQNSLQRLLESYGLTFEQALVVRTGLPSRREAMEEIAVRREELTDIGEVYLGSIEEYQKLTERLYFLTGQRADLEEAKQALYQVIAEMDSLMTKKFAETFREVRFSFNQVFQELFGGGRAELRLDDEQNILECGIEIIAQPPGKKLQNLSLLSGGERSLTAIALLFAVLNTRPSPFCVLDEIEAALDETNAERFAMFLTDYARETQFIVISHRKQTMEVGNVLYGVTMEDSGVSKLVSVKLADALEKVS